MQNKVIFLHSFYIPPIVLYSICTIFKSLNWYSIQKIDKERTLSIYFSIQLYMVSIFNFYKAYQAMFSSFQPRWIKTALSFVSLV